MFSGARVKAALAASAMGVAFGAASAGADDAVTNVSFSFDHVSCSGAPNEVRIVVTDVRESVGLIVADLYRNDEDGFLKRDGRVQQVRFAAKSPVTAFCMRAENNEPHAIAVYHDRNANKTLDKKALGLPDEPWGISNDPKIRFGPPKVGEALFEVAEHGANVEIKLKN